MATFNFTFAPGTTLQQMTGFEIAGRTWASLLADNTTINLYVGVSNQLPDRVIGGALTGFQASYNYTDFYNKLASDRKSPSDYTAVNSLAAYTSNPTPPTLTLGSRTLSLGRSTPPIASPPTSLNSWFDLTINGQNQGYTATTSTINLTRANAKALGIPLEGGTDALDGYILFSDLANYPSLGWSYDYSGTTFASATYGSSSFSSRTMTISSTPSDRLDFVTIAFHEIGHILGFVSGVDQPGALNSTVQSQDELQAYQTAANSRVTYTNPLDLFRYSTESASKGLNDLSYGGSKYFSIDKGATNLGNFGTGVDTSLGGSGDQASHWDRTISSNNIMMPALSLGSRLPISGLDLQALDVIGWDIPLSSYSINFAALATQARQFLADRLGQTVDWLNANEAEATNQLTQNRDQDIYAMLASSQVYDMTRVVQPGSTGWVSRQTLADVLGQRGLFQTLDEVLDEALDDPSVTSTTLGSTAVGMSRADISNIQKIARFYGAEQNQSVALGKPDPRLQSLATGVSTASLSPELPPAPRATSLPAVRAYDNGLWWANRTSTLEKSGTVDAIPEDLDPLYNLAEIAL